MARKIDLLVIDPQNSFCKKVEASQQQILHDGELCVGGAWEDTIRIANLVNRLSDKLNDIHCTLDSHHLFHIAHPVWFKDPQGNNPSPFTIMREENDKIIGSSFGPNGPSDIGEFFCTIPQYQTRTLKYLQSLKNNNRYPHCIWPPHCLIGTSGHNVVPHLFDAFLNWEKKNYASVDYVTKGSNHFVEHFSAVKAEVVDPGDPSTQINKRLIDILDSCDEVIVSGEAGSHCLANTIVDIADQFPDDSFIKKCVLLTDGTSPVPGFEKYQSDFIAKMTARGMKVSTCADYLA
jgi:nicotinamidase/pyrazinamidase